jgi:hypothetical protein
MPVGTDTFKGGYDRGTPSFPASFSSEWVDANTNVLLLDNASITSPATQITDDTRKIISRAGWQGTSLCVRLLYDQAAAGGDGPTLAVFGRFNSNHPWERLLNRANNRTLTFTPSATHVLFTAALRATEVHSTNYVIDHLGCNEFLVGVEVVGSGGVTTASKVQVKFI